MLLTTYRAVKAECEEHHEEDEGPECGGRQGGYGLRVHYEYQPRT